MKIRSIIDYANNRLHNIIKNIIWFKISYHKRWDKEGTTYDQMISVQMTREDFLKMNEIIACYLVHYEYNHDKIYLDTFHKGDNYTTHTQRNFFLHYWKLKDNKGIKDRNTIIRIKFY